jgi:DsbC/DsbD-like thiol-disulfide interchange protein
MNTAKLSCWRRVPILAGIAALTASGSAFAQESSPWVNDKYSSLRLVSGAPQGSNAIAGIEIALKPGWKTYWRMPGDSGIPPRFDFSQSDNVETVTVLWPAPSKFPDGAGGHSIGYADAVMLPLKITRKNSSSPVTLRATVDYAVCEKLCVPVQASVELKMAMTSPPANARLASALENIPKPAKVGEGDLTIQTVRREGDRKVVVDARVPQGSRAELFVEGPTPHWALPLPVALGAPAPGLRRFAFDLDGVPAGAKVSGSTLKFTLIGSDHAYEYDVKLP